jgi:dihydrolipoamide dehydrogenase
MRRVDLAILGAGHAGLNAVKAARRARARWVLIDGGPLGTTCARVGCMPSKAIIELAQHAGPSPDVPALLERVRELRDTFVDLVLANSTDTMEEGRELLRGEARFLEPDLLEVNGERIRAGGVIVATGSSPVIPHPWQALGDRVLTSDHLWDLERLPASLAVVGLGPIGLELGQALHRLGVRVTGFDAADAVAGLADREVSRAAVEALRREFPIHLGREVTGELAPDSQGVRVRAGDVEVLAERVLVAVGRRPNIPAGLTDFCETDDAGIPLHDARTLQIGDLPVYLAGDATGARMLLQDAAEEGRIAADNALRESPFPRVPKVPMAIAFADPQIAQVGLRFNELPADTVVATQRFGPVGRALIMGRNRGLIRLYAEPGSGRLLGAAMAGPRVEHLAHLVAWAVSLGLDVHSMLRLPFYHPVIEEGLQDALHTMARALAAAAPRLSAEAA